MSTRLMRTAAAVTAAALTAALALPVRAEAYSGGTVYLQTVPAMSGVLLSVGGAQVQTDGSGAASVSLNDINGIASRVRLASGYVNDATSVAIDRIVSGTHVPHSSHLSVGLDVTSRVKIKLSSASSSLTTDRVQSLDLHSVVGESKSIDPAKQDVVELLSRRSQFQHGVLVPQTVTWSVHGSYSGGGATITTKQPRFDPLLHSTWTMQLDNMQGTVQIDTVPQTPGVVFLLEGATATTGANGSVTVPVKNLNDLDTRLQLETQEAGQLQVAHMRVRKLPPPGVGQRRVVVALDIWRPVKFSFIDHNGASIPAARITGVQVKANNTLVNLPAEQLQSPTPLQAKLAEYVDSRWQARPVTYSIVAVHVDGSNAVFSGTQRFRPEDGDTWQVTLSLFTLTVVTRDALFGTTVSSPAVLVRPDGSHANVRLGGNTDNRLASMVRGMYTLQLTAAALGSRTTVLVSRDDKITLRVVTVVDALVVAAVFFLVLLAMVFGGVVVARRRAATETRCHRGTSVPEIRRHGDHGSAGRHRAVLLSVDRAGGATGGDADAPVSVGRQGSRVRVFLSMVYEVILAPGQNGLSSRRNL